MKKHLFITLLFFQINLFGQNSNIQIIDFSKTQIDLMNSVISEPIEKRNSILIDSIYKPYSYLWQSYIGDESSFIYWMNNTAFNEIETYNLKTKTINLTKLNEYFFHTVEEMEKFTGHKAFGKWYVFFGPKWTDLGGFSDGTMLIDLAHEANQNLNDIQQFFPHEINHQIYSNTIKMNNNAVLYRILDEGFACYVSYLFHKGGTTIADELVYSDAEYNLCVENEQELITLLRESYTSDSENLSDNFANRDYHFLDKFPGAIGYYIGFRIVEEFVKENGKDSWKRIYTISPEQVLEESKILD